MPVESWHTQDGFLPAVREYQSVFERFPARVHVWMQAHQLYILAHFKSSIHLVIRIARRNFEGSVRSRERQHALFRWSLCKNKSELGLVRRGRSVRRVMHFKNDVRPGFDQLALAGMENFGGLAWRIADKKIAWQRTRVRLFVNFWRRSHKKDSLLLVLEVVRSWLPQVRDDVVDHRAVRRPHLEHLHPFVFLKIGGDDYILIVNNA